MKSTPARSLLKRLLATGAVLLLLGSLAYVFRTQILTALANGLIVDDSPQQPADIIYILNGEVNTRPFHAAKLFEQGLAPHIVIAKAEDGPAAEAGLFPNDTDVSVEILQELGIPADKITVLSIEGGVTSTRDEAVVLRGYAQAQGIRRVIVVTSAFHTRRSKWIFEKELSGTNIRLAISAAPQWKFDATNWWHEERGLLMFFEEYLKLGYYFARYR